MAHEQNSQTAGQLHTCLWNSLLNPHTHIFHTNHTLQFMTLEYITEEVGRNENIGSFIFVVSNMNILPDLQFSF